MNYDLSHLTQDSSQSVFGPVQDDEALLLFALCRAARIKLVVEIGVFHGYSTNNFIKAVSPIGGMVIGIDVFDAGIRHEKLKFICSSAADVDPSEIDDEIGLVFFDSHNFEAQKAFMVKMTESKKITDRTIIAIHDTNFHPGGIAHQPAEREFSNWLMGKGWSPFHVRTYDKDHGPDLPFRHGLTLLCRNPILKK